MWVHLGAYLPHHPGHVGRKPLCQLCSYRLEKALVMMMTSDVTLCTSIMTRGQRAEHPWRPENPRDPERSGLLKVQHAGCLARKLQQTREEWPVFHTR